MCIIAAAKSNAHYCGLCDVLIWLGTSNREEMLHTLDAGGRSFDNYLLTTLRRNAMNVALLAMMSVDVCFAVYLNKFPWVPKINNKCAIPSTTGFLICQFYKFLIKCVI